MSAPAYEAKARKHWAKWLPKKVEQLKASGQYEPTMQAVGKQAQERVIELMQAGYQQHEAEEVALAELVLLAPEPGAGLEPWELAEMKALDAEHRKLRG